MRKKARLSSEDEGPEEPLINLTPLIDVVFVVLISFMLIAPILSIDSVDLALSGPGSQKESPSVESSAIAISVRSDNSIWMQGRSLTLPQLELQLKDLKKRHPKAVPQLAQDTKAQFGTYQAVKNALEAAGFEQMDVILKPN